jgi:hypothetical protein
MLVRRVVTSFMFLFFVAAGTVAVSAQWRQLGTKEVDYRVDHDTINVGLLRGDFRRVKLQVRNAPIRIQRMVITYRNGQTQNVQLRNLIRAGGETRAINLSGNERVIRKVDLWYQSASMGRRKARVTLLGRD